MWRFTSRHTYCKFTFFSRISILSSAFLCLLFGQYVPSCCFSYRRDYNGSVSGRQNAYPLDHQRCSVWLSALQCFCTNGAALAGWRADNQTRLLWLFRKKSNFAVRDLH